MLLAIISLPASLMVVGGDRHQRNAYKYAFFMSAILTQLAMLASWTMRHWFQGRRRISMTFSDTMDYLICLWFITCALGWFTGHWGKLMQAKTLVLAWSSYTLICISISYGGTLIHLLNNRGDPNFDHKLNITIGTWACNVFAHGLWIYLSR
ncbi:hypothetical protein L210DRAFT_3560291 [Boletus edulis BED1]|uniref:Uncharacterized protein n=1 Tax=Boletus edulis BED1 TaxID=1328754 RepID=A0AAD4BIF3_BOLED|nr:hypothetical protein L210DRAFT_3560291 [Boletus edulis BED1]